MIPSNENFLHSRKQLYVRLNSLYEKGYRYITRDNDSMYIKCYSLKPQKYNEWEGWGYKNPNLKGVLMAYAIKNTDCTEISWNNKEPLKIKDFLSNTNE